jgi:hypothetical protein
VEVKGEYKMSCSLETWKNIASICASFVAIIGIIGAGVGVIISLRTYKSNNALRKIDLIHKLYDQYLKEQWYEFYEVVKKEKVFNLEIYEKQLNQSLTFFDEIDYYYCQGLIDDKSLEYFASEILNFYNNETVMKYVRDTESKYRELNFPPEIIPFSGFTALIKKTLDKYKIKKK